MCKRKIKRQFKNFRIYKELYEKPLKHDGWEELFFSYKSFYFSPAVAIAASGIYGLKFLGHLILICSFSLC